MNSEELKELRKATIDNTTDETTWGGPAGDILTGIRNAENAPAERAIWELVQNARDVSWESVPAVISFARTTNGLEFVHYGKPFTNTSLESLIKQTSSKVRSDIKTVGKYGTGFLITHQFGRIIHLAGILQVVDGRELYYHFPELILDRSFEDKDLLKDSLKKQAEKVKGWGFDPAVLTENAHGKTVFKYDARFNAERDALQRAFENAPNQAPYVLTLNSRYIQQIEFKDEVQGIIGRFSLGEYVGKPVGEGDSYILKRTDIKEEGVRNKDHTIYTLSSKTIDERVDDSVVTVILPIEQDGENYKAKLLETGLAKLYLSLPLIGTENWGLNMIVHSPLFECENDSRSGLRIVPQGLGLPENENNRMLECSYQMVAEWMKNTLEQVSDRKYLGKVCFDNTSKNQAVVEFNECLQEKWVSLMATMPIALNNYGVYMKPQDLIVVDDAMAKYAIENAGFRKAIYEVLLKQYAAQIPEYKDYLFWSKQISKWRTEDSQKHILCIEDIVKAIEAAKWNEAEGGQTNEWLDYLKSIILYLIETGNEALLSYSITPNEDCKLHDIKELHVPTDFSTAYRTVIDTIVPDERERFIHTDFRRLGISNLGDYGEQDAKDALTKRLGELQTTVNNRLKGIEADVKEGRFKPEDEKWEEVMADDVLLAIIRLFSMWTGDMSDNLESKLLRLFCEYLGIEIPSGETITKTYFTDSEQMWRTILFEIIYRFNRLSNTEQTAKKDWLKRLVGVLNSYSSTEDYLKRFMLFPDQTGVVRYSDDVFGGKGIDQLMKDYYDAIVSKEGETVKTKLVDDEFAAYLPNKTVWDNQTLGGEIEKVVSKVEGYPNLEKYEKKAVVLQIVKRFEDSEEGKKWSDYFKVLSVHKTQILLTFAESDSVFTLLLQPESRLKALSEIAADEHCDEILKQAKAAQEQRMYEDADMLYKRELGLYVERYLVEQLGKMLKENEALKAASDGSTLTDQDVQGGQDVIIYLERGEKKIPLYYIEVKSRWSTKESVEMSKLQMETSSKEKERYALCVVDMHDYDKEKVFKKEYPKTFEEIKKRISVVDEIGDKNAGLIPYTNDSKTEVHIGGEVKSVVPQGYVKTVKKDFDNLLGIVAEKVREYYNNELDQTNN